MGTSNDSESKVEESVASTTGLSTTTTTAHHCCNNCKSDKWFKVICVIVIIALFSYIIVLSILDKSKESMDDHRLVELHERVTELEEYLEESHDYEPHMKMAATRASKNQPNQNKKKKRSQLPLDLVPHELRSLIDTDPPAPDPNPPNDAPTVQFGFVNPTSKFSRFSLPPRMPPGQSSAPTVGVVGTRPLIATTPTPSPEFSAPGDRSQPDTGNDANQNRGYSFKTFNTDDPQKQGSTYIRWGKHTCPNTATVVYTGYTAGAYPIKGFGGTVDMQCLPLAPSWQPNAQNGSITRNLITAVKFSLGGDTTFPSAAENSVIKCVVCLSERSPVLMIPGEVSCPYGWAKEYSGFFMSSPGVTDEYYLSSRGYCVDEVPDYYTGHNDQINPKLTFLQAGHCYRDQTPCKDYSISRKLGCVVCSSRPDVVFK